MYTILEHEYKVILEMWVNVHVDLQNAITVSYKKLQNWNVASLQLQINVVSKKYKHGPAEKNHKVSQEIATLQVLHSENGVYR